MDTRQLTVSQFRSLMLIVYISHLPIVVCSERCCLFCIKISSFTFCHSVYLRSLVLVPTYCILDPKFRPLFCSIKVTLCFVFAFLHSGRWQQTHSHIRLRFSYRLQKKSVNILWGGIVFCVVLLYVWFYTVYLWMTDIFPIIELSVL